MEHYVETLNIRKFKKEKDYQEIFFLGKSFSNKNSIRLPYSDIDIEKLLKKWWLGYKSSIEIHYRLGYEIKIVIDKTVIMDLDEDHYPQRLKDLLQERQAQEEIFRKELNFFIRHYPLTKDLPQSIDRYKNLWLRTCAGCLIKKAAPKTEEEQKKFSLLLDLLYILEQMRDTFYVQPWDIMTLKDPIELEESLRGIKGFFSAITYIKSMKLHQINGYNSQIAYYLDALLCNWHNTYRADKELLEHKRLQGFSIFHTLQIDKNFLLNYCSKLQLFRDNQNIPNYLTNYLLQTEDIREYLEEKA